MDSSLEGLLQRTDHAARVAQGPPEQRLRRHAGLWDASAGDNRVVRCGRSNGDVSEISRKEVTVVNQIE